MSECFFPKGDKKLKRTLIVLLMVLGLTAALFAQNPQPRFGRPPIANPPGDGSTVNQGGRPVDPLAGLRAALNLTDAQVTAIQTLMTTQRTRMDVLRTEIEQKRATLENLLNAATPNPADVGNAAIAVRASERKLPGERDWLIAELKKLLTGEQQQKLDTVIAANSGGLPFLGGPGPVGPGPVGPGPVAPGPRR